MKIRVTVLIKQLISKAVKMYTDTAIVLIICDRILENHPYDRA